jgi:hypothetical protein
MVNFRHSSPRHHDADLEWAKSSGIPLLLVGVMILATGALLPDDLPFPYLQSRQTQASQSVWP